MGKRRMFLRIHIRLLPVATSAHPQIHTSAFYRSPNGHAKLWRQRKRPSYCKLI